MKSGILSVFVCLSFLGFGQDSDSTEVEEKNKKVKVLPVPAFGVTPETGPYVGAVALFTLDFYQDTLTRTSNAKLEFNYTWKKQSILEAGWNYFFKEESWFTDGKIHFSKFPDLYYGVGPNTLNESEEGFDGNRFTIETTGLKKVYPHKFVGIGMRYAKYYNVRSLVDNSKFDLQDGQNLELTLRGMHDSRNNLLNATSGSYFDVRFGYNFGFLDQNNPSLILYKRPSYGKLKIDARKYHTWKDKYTLAVRLWNEITIGSPPNFYDYALLGGDQNTRGYYFGRYRDYNLTSLQVEGRIDLFWRLDMAVFGGAASVYGPVNDQLTIRVVPNGGLGLRILADKNENINLRLDYAIGVDGQSGFYVSFGESF
jgi:hypothetical protein